MPPATGIKLLHEQIETRSREISTDGYSMSIGQFVSTYKDQDIEIHPEFQRIFRWSGEQKSRLVESILLGIPIPPIFVAQRKDGIWDVVDGVQRLSTILQFVGEYRDEHGDELEPLRLVSGEYLSELDGYTYQELVSNEEDSKFFDEVLRRDFKRARLDFVIVKKESDEDAKFDLFQRLNSGTGLSEQEARNCLLIMLDRNFFDWVTQLAEIDSFQACVSLSQRKEDEGLHKEMVLRFLMHIDHPDNTSRLREEFSTHITNWMRKAALDQEYPQSARESLFTESFNCIARALGEDAFRRWDDSRQGFSGGFSTALFEAMTSGVSHNLDIWAEADPNLLARKAKSVWTNSEFRQNSGTGVSTRSRLPQMISFGRSYFSRTD